MFRLISKEVKCTIVVDIDSYKTATEAAENYNAVDWDDNNSKEDAVCISALAAVEMQNYLAHIIGIDKNNIPIIDDGENIPPGNIICINIPKDIRYKKIRNKTKRYWKKQKSKNRQGFRIDSFAAKEINGIILSGRTPIGVLYAVYELLERWGVRWLAPEDNGEIIPSLSHISVYNVHEYYEPSMKIRGFWVDKERSLDKENPELYKWLGRNRINFYCHCLEDIGALKQRGVLINTGRQDVVSTLLKPSYQYRYNHPKHVGDEQFPIDPYIISDYYKSDADGNGTFSYFEAHPEWFVPEFNESIKVNVDSINGSFCISNNEAIKEFCTLIVDKLTFGEWQKIDIVDLWSPNLWCDCPNCQKIGNEADKLLYLIYNVEKAIRKAFDKHKIKKNVMVTGYTQPREKEAPHVKLPKDFDYDDAAVFLFVGPRCYNHYIIDPACSAINIWFSKLLFEWLDEESPYQGDVFVSENYNASYFRDLPVVHSSVMEIDVPAYYELGISGINFMNARTHDLGVHALLNYLFARQTWNVNVDIDTLKLEFMRLYYPGISDQMKIFYDKLERVMATATTWRYYLPLKLETLVENAENGKNNILTTVNERFEAQNGKYETSFNYYWEQTYHLIYDARFILDQVLVKEVPEFVKNRLHCIDNQLKYAELTINLYDNVIMYLTLGEDDSEMRQEALLRLAVNAKAMEEFTITSPILGISNGLEASGIATYVNRLINIANAEDTK